MPITDNPEEAAKVKAKILPLVKDLFQSADEMEYEVERRLSYQPAVHVKLCETALRKFDILYETLTKDYDIDEKLLWEQLGYKRVREIGDIVVYPSEEQVKEEKKKAPEWSENYNDLKVEQAKRFAGELVSCFWRTVGRFEITENDIGVPSWHSLGKSTAGTLYKDYMAQANISANNGNPEAQNIKSQNPVYATEDRSSQRKYLASKLAKEIGDIVNSDIESFPALVIKNPIKEYLPQLLKEGVDIDTENSLKLMDQSLSEIPDAYTVSTDEVVAINLKKLVKVLQNEAQDEIKT